ncbi:MAG: glycoside hydrolase family 27 protein [Prevotella sp.]|jgi:alpha-galactosidase|nr:glycoside hydrolase family 27 protein [Prevotella sp.]
MKSIITFFLLFIGICNFSLAQQEFGKQDQSVISGFDKLARTPPMGWNSWNKFGCNVSEKLIKEMADAIVSSGMKDAGYEYVVIDDCWQTGRDEKGNIIVDKDHFPNGMKPVADYVHSLGLKFGIYSCAGSKTCQGRPGSRGYQFQDARQYAKWGVDYLKYDWCYNEGQDAKAAYKTMSDALKACGRPIVFSICEWGENKPWEWGKGIGHLWRITADIRDCYDCKFNWGGVGVLQILDKALTINQYSGPGHWNDLEMLEIGNGGQTEHEYRSHFAIWSMMSAPLMAGNDIRNMDALTKEILLNKEAIAINQDKLGKTAFRFVTLNGIDILVKALSGGDVAFLFVNRNNFNIDLDYNWNFDTVYDESLENGSLYMKRTPRKIKNIWTQQEMGTTDTPLRKVLEPHESLFVRLRK